MSATMLSFWAAGTPAPKGSKIRTRYGMRESSKRVKPWEEAVKAAAMDAMDADDEFQPIEEGGVEVAMTFMFKRPLSHYGTGKNWNKMKDRFVWACMTRKPDVDKLVRSTLDAMTAAGVWADDAQVYSVFADKNWSNDRTKEGARIIVSTEHRGEDDEDYSDEELSDEELEAEYERDADEGRALHGC